MANRNATAFSRLTGLSTTLAKFSTASCVLACAVRSLEHWDNLNGLPGSETACLRHGLELLETAYNDLDAAIVYMQDDRNGD